MIATCEDHFKYLIMRAGGNLILGLSSSFVTYDSSLWPFYFCYILEYTVGVVEGQAKSESNPEVTASSNMSSIGKSFK